MTRVLYSLSWISAPTKSALAPKRVRFCASVALATRWTIRLSSLKVNLSGSLTALKSSTSLRGAMYCGAWARVKVASGPPFSFSWKEKGGPLATFTLAQAPQYIAPRKLVLDFSAVNEPLKFTFKDDSLIVQRVAKATLAQNLTRFGASADFVGALIHDKEYSTLVIN